MRTVRLIIAYDGTRYEGWQSQRKNSTLQELFEKSLEKVLGAPTPIVASSRTDSGVHARGLVAHIKISKVIPDKKIKAALNFYLPADIAVLAAKTMTKPFHARFDAKSKLYEYRIWNTDTKPVFEAKYSTWFQQKLDVKAMRRAAKCLIGKHDFKSFQDRDTDTKTSMRTLKKITLYKEGELIRIQIQANGFLKYMVRIIVGTLIEIGRGRMKPEEMSRILKTKDRTQAGPTAKPQGLTLLKVSY